MTCDMRYWIGAYVLDALEPDETESLAHHIAECCTCQDEVVSLAWIPPLLRTVQLEDVERIDTPFEAGSSRVLDALLAKASHRSRTRRAVAALGLVAALLTGVLIYNVASSEPAHSPVTTVRTVDPGSHVAAAVTLTSRSGGTNLFLSLRGVPPGETCSLIVHTRDGRHELATSWTASYLGTAKVPARTSTPARQISALDVVTASGTRLVHVAVRTNNH